MLEAEEAPAGTMESSSLLEIAAFSYTRRSAMAWRPTSIVKGPATTQGRSETSSLASSTVIDDASFCNRAVRST